MNKKTLAVAALALIATSGLASAQTVRQQPRLERDVRIVNPHVNSNAAIYGEYNRFNAPNVRGRYDADSSRFYEWRDGANTG